MDKEMILDIIDAKFNEWDIKSPNAKQVAYECTIECTKHLTDQLADLQSQLTLSEAKVKLNYNTACEFERQLAAKDKELSDIKESINSIKDISFNSHSMGCGLEDANITDRYEAMKYGYECALDEINQII